MIELKMYTVETKHKVVNELSKSCLKTGDNVTLKSGYWTLPTENGI